MCACLYEYLNIKKCAICFASLKGAETYSIKKNNSLFSLCDFPEEYLSAHPVKKRGRKRNVVPKPPSENSSEASAEAVSESPKKNIPFAFPFPNHTPSESKIPSIPGYSREEVLFYMGLAIYHMTQ